MMQVSTRYYTILMIVAGLSIGGVFSMYPTIILALFGKSNFGKVLSLIAVATSSSSIVIASLLASVYYEQNADESGYCYGASCFYNAFFVNSLLCWFAFVLSMALTRDPMIVK